MQAPVQVRILTDSFRILGGRGTDSPLENVYVALLSHLAAIPEIVNVRMGEPQQQQQGQRRRQRRAWLVPAAEVPDTSHILEFDGASRGNPGPSGAGAILFAPAASGGAVLWATSTFLGHGTNNSSEYQGASYTRLAAPCAS